MENLLAQINDSDVERAEDRVGGFRRLDSDIYIATIKTAYLGESSGGAAYVTLVCDISGQEYRETLYISNKNKEVFYYTSNNKKAPLPGYALFKNICIVCTGKEPNKMSVEEKIIKVYNFETSQDELKSVPVVTELTGKEVALGILKELVNKRQKNSKGDYVEIADYNETNRISAVFHPVQKKTVNEATDNKEAAFWDEWLKANQGKVKDRRKIKESSDNVPFTDAKPKTGYKSVFDN